jgi:curved DNA-binding protein
VKDYYKILEISINANNDEIKKAFRSLAKKYHPDRNANDADALRKFQEVNEAYEVLSNEDSRKQYDKKISDFKQGNSTGTNSKNNKSNNYKRRSQDKSDSIENLNKYFESFFGFDANTNDINKDKLKNKKNPIDTSNMFESFFKPHSKK